MAAADPTLVKGAYGAADIGAPQLRDVPIDKSLQTAGEAVKKQMAAQQKKKEQEAIEEQVRVEAEKKRIAAEQLQQQKQEAKALEGFQKNADTILVEGGSNEYKQQLIHEQLQTGVDAFHECETKECREKLMAKQTELQNKLANVNDFEVTVANNIKNMEGAPDSDGSGIRKSYALTPQGEGIASIPGGLNPLVINEENGNFGWMIYDPEIQEARIAERDRFNAELEGLDTNPPLDMSFQEIGLRRIELQNEIEKKIEEITEAEHDTTIDNIFMNQQDVNTLMDTYSFDQSSSDVFAEAMEKLRNDGFNTPLGKDSNIDWEAQARWIRKSLLGPGNNRSLRFDPIIGDADSLYDNLWKALNKGTYEQLYNLDSEDWVDPNLDGDNDPNTISDKDAQTIAKELLKNDDTAEELDVLYYLNALKNNHQAGLDSRPKDEE